MLASFAGSGVGIGVASVFVGSGVTDGFASSCCPPHAARESVMTAAITTAKSLAFLNFFILLFLGAMPLF